jgi:hypothetical protein
VDEVKKALKKFRLNPSSEREESKKDEQEPVDPPKRRLFNFGVATTHGMTEIDKGPNPQREWGRRLEERIAEAEGDAWVPN